MKIKLSELRQIIREEIVKMHYRNAPTKKEVQSSFDRNNTISQLEKTYGLKNIKVVNGKIKSFDLDERYWKLK